MNNIVSDFIEDLSLSTYQELLKSNDFQGLKNNLIQLQAMIEMAEIQLQEGINIASIKSEQMIQQTQGEDNTWYGARANNYWIEAEAHIWRAKQINVLNNMQTLMQKTYQIIFLIREFFIGEKIIYRIGAQSSTSEAEGMLLEKEISEEELLTHSFIEIRALTNTITSAQIQLQLHTTALRNLLDNDFQNALNQRENDTNDENEAYLETVKRGSTLWSDITKAVRYVTARRKTLRGISDNFIDIDSKIDGKIKKTVNKGRVYEIYTYFNGNQNNRQGEKISLQKILDKTQEVLQDSRPSLFGGDFQNIQLKYVGGARAGLISLNLIKNSVKTIIGLLRLPSIEKIKSTLSKYFTGSLSTKIEDAAFRVGTSSVDKALQTLNKT